MALRHLICDESGQGLFEYGLILALASIAAIAVLLLMGPQIKGMYDVASGKLDQVPGVSGGAG